MLSFLVLIVLCLCSVTQTAKLPANFPICKLDHAVLPDCFAKAVEKTLKILKEPVPELGIPSINPIEVENLRLEGGQGSIVLNQDLKKVQIFNMELAKVRKAEIKLDGQDFNNRLFTFVPEMKLIADYEITGRILLLPIQGNGKMEINVYNLTTVLTMIGTHVEKKGTVYLKVLNTTCTISPGLVKMHFSNLFNGDKLLGDNMNQVMNENWEEVFNEFKGIYEEVLGQYVHNIASQVFNKVPLKDLFPPP